VIYSRHSPLNVSEQKLSPLAVRCLYNLYALSGGALVTVSERLRDELQRTLVGRRPVHLIANAVLSQRVQQLAENGVDDGVAGDYFCAVGRLVPVKGFDLLLQAYALARRQRGGLPGLLIVGEGEQRGQLQALAAALGIAGAVRFHGYTSNPYYLMKRAKAFVLSSRHEGMPTVLVEAMALGTPVISFDCTSGPAELIGDSSRGLLVPAEDVDALAAALVRYDSVPAADASAVERFRFERAAEAYLQLLAA
jgi:glycosyltransferase involved in cell wall biosynthesis